MMTEQNKSPPMDEADRAAHWEHIARRYHELFTKRSRERADLRIQKAALLEALENALPFMPEWPVKDAARVAIAKAQGQT